MNLQKGSKGNLVVSWQKFIGVTPDGDFGKKTAEATRFWQAQNGLRADGIVGAQSLKIAQQLGLVLPVTVATEPISNTNMKFDRQKFYDGFRRWRGKITDEQVKGLEFLFESIENDPHVSRLDWVAYMLATTMHETAFTFLPIHEYGGKAYFVKRYGGQTALGERLGNDTPDEGAIYAGQGYVQLTGEDNYERAEIAVRREYPEVIANWEKKTGKKFDLTVGDQPNDFADPNNAQDPQIAYVIMSFGMRTGMFTGKKLSNYFNSKQDWFNARRIINGIDHAQLIANSGKRFEQVLSAAKI